MADEYSCMSQEELQIVVQDKDQRIAELEAQHKQDFLYYTALEKKDADSQEEIERLRAWHRETLSECAQENADGEPFDTFNEIATNALFTDETPESVCKAALKEE